MLEFVAVAIAVVAGLGAGIFWIAGKFNHKASPHTYAVEAYLTENPEDPPKQRSNEQKLLGIQQGTPASQLRDMFPPDAEHVVDPERGPGGTRLERWRWRGLEVSAELKRGAVKTVWVSLQEPDRDDQEVYASLPHGLLLGRSRIRDLIAAWGQPSDASAIIEGANLPVYTLEYTSGPEASIAVTYQAAIGPGGPTLPRGRINESACDETLIGFALHGMGEIREAKWPRTGLCKG